MLDMEAPGARGGASGGGDGAKQAAGTHTIAENGNAFKSIGAVAQPFAAAVLARWIAKGGRERDARREMAERWLDEEGGRA